MPLRPGDIVSSSRYRYTVLQQIGEGGMSNIYLCQCNAPAGSADGGRWVLKEMTVSYRNRDDQDNAVKLFLREAELLQHLRHKNLPRVLEQFVVENRYYTVMEFVQGEDLGKILLRKPHGFDEPKVIQWGIEIATVLYYLHSQKPPIIFRDLKPSNIMISRGQVKLIDFGIARRFDAFKKKDTMRIGSPGYAPPEQYSGQTDRRSDIYALGVTLHQLLTGRDPSETQTPFKLPSARALKPTLSLAMENIIIQATELDPQRRFKTALEMKRALQVLLGVQSGPLPQRTGQMPSGPLIPSPAPNVSGSAASRPAQAVASSPPARAANPFSRPGAPAPAQGGAASPYVRPSGEASASHGGDGTSPAPPPAAPPAATPSGVSAAGAAPKAPPVKGSSIPSASPAAQPTAQPRPRASRKPFMFVLFMLMLFGYGYHKEAVSLYRWIQGAERPRTVVDQPVPASPSPSASPTVMPSPVPIEPIRQALALLDEGKVEPALEILETSRKAEPSSGLGLLAYNNALAIAERRPSAVLQVVYADDAYGRDWLRGVALAQRDLNRAGGIRGRLLLLAPEATDPKAMDASRLASAAGKAFGVLLDVPVQGLRAFGEAYTKASLPAISGSPRGLAGDVTSAGTSIALLTRAFRAAVGEIKPKSVAIVTSAGWPDAESSTLAGELRKLRFGRAGLTVRTFRVEAVKDVSAASPDLVVFLGDARALDAFATLASEARLAAPVLSGPAALTLTHDTGPAGQWMKNGRLWVISPYNPASPVDPWQDRFAMAYARAFQLKTPPGLSAAEGLELLHAVARALEAAEFDFTPAGLSAALQAAPTTPPSFSGVALSPAQKPPAAWWLLRMQDEALKAKAVTP